MWWKFIYYVSTLSILAWSLFTPKGRASWGWFFNNFIAAALKEATPLLNELAPSLQVILQGFVDSFEKFGPAMRESVAGPVGNLVADNFAVATGNLRLGGESTPDNAIDQAQQAFKQAYGFGIASTAVTAAFEAVFPEKLNVLNAMGPAFAGMAGFEEVSKNVLEPLYKNAFGIALEYHFKSEFKPDLASEGDAVQWHSRRLMSDDDLREVFKYSGLKAKYEDAFVKSAYRAVQPRAVMALLQDVDFPEAQMTDLLQFAGLRDQDINFLLPLMKLNSTKNVRFGYLTALKRSVELGTDTMAHLDAAMNTMQFSDDAKFWVQEEVNERKTQQLAELYRKSVSESYQFGTLTDQQYVPALEAIGIAQADAQAHYTIDSIKKHGKIAAALLRAEERLAANRMRAAMQAAIAEYLVGRIDVAALEAALLVAGVDPVVASFAVVIQEARRTGTQVLVYGVELPRHEALLLREKVAALKEQAIKKLGTPASWLATLAALGIPDANAQALVSEWEARANKLILPI